jgi:hypothetical protein
MYITVVLCLCNDLVCFVMFSVVRVIHLVSGMKDTE